MTHIIKTRLRLADDFVASIGRAGLTIVEFSRRSGVSYAALKGLINPSHQPKRRGGMRPDTAWKLARAYAETVHTDEETAYRRLIVEERSRLPHNLD